MIFAAIEPLSNQDTANQLGGMGLYATGSILILGIGYILWLSAPRILAYSRRKNAEKVKAENAIWFDGTESELHCGHHKTRIEPKSFEHFVCKIVFKTPNEYTSDLDIFDEADRAKGIRETKRGVEQATRRLNIKAKKMGLKEDLFKRSKESTSVNDLYRQHIVKK